MSFSTEIAAWFKDNEVFFRVLATLAAPGGIWFWIDRYRNRVRIKIRRLSLAEGRDRNPCVSFEAENIGSTLTSFEPEFSLVGYSAERKAVTFTFRFEGADRQLPPHAPKQFLGCRNYAGNGDLFFLWFMVFRFPLSGGRDARVRIRNGSFDPVGFFRFTWERFVFVRLGRVPKE